MALMIDKFRFELRQNFLLRWVVANIVGWTVGLYFGVLNPVCFAVVGVVTGLILGAFQWWALRDTALGIHSSESASSISTRIFTEARQWMVSTFAGAAVGLFPALALGTLLYLISNGLAGLLAGGALGLAVGIGQWMILKHVSDQVVLWLVMNTVGGALCGFLTLTPIIRGLPLGLLAGSALFGYLTGRVLERILRETR
jgi:hypothetical protein